MKKGTIYVASLAVCWLGALAPATAWATPYTVGDVFADVGGGIIKEFTPAGVLVQSLNTTHPGEGDGMAFDSSGNLYATSGFAANTVVKFNNSGTLITANFGSGYNSHPESISIDNTHGIVYVGQADGNGTVLSFNESGTPISSFSVTRQNRGSDWIDLQGDLSTIRYTSEGNTVFTYNTSTSTQGAPVTTSLVGGDCYADRSISGGGELVACSSEVDETNAAGAVIKTYTIPGTSLLFALNLDPNGLDFWTADYFTGNVFEVNIATGHIDESWNAGLVGGGPLGGLALFGETCAAGCNTNPPSVPEPITLTLLGTGLAVGAVRRRFARK